MRKSQEHRIANNELHRYRLQTVDFSADTAISFIDRAFPPIEPTPTPVVEMPVEPVVAPENVISLGEQLVQAGLSEVDTVRAKVADALKEPAHEIQEFNDTVAV